MKILKKATQKNVLLENGYYTNNEINEMLTAKEICYFDKDMNECYEPLKYSWQFHETELRIFTENLEELKVVLDEYGSYTNVAIGKNGKKYYVTL